MTDAMSPFRVRIFIFTNGFRNSAANRFLGCRKAPLSTPLFHLHPPSTCTTSIDSSLSAVGRQRSMSIGESLKKFLRRASKATDEALKDGMDSAETDPSLKDLIAYSRN